MRRAGRIALALGPWIAVGLLLWREQQLEEGLSKFIAATNDALQVRLRDMTAQASDMAHEAAAAGGHVL